jgi:hypothetical protein
MASKLNHHFVPQYLFGFFTRGERRVHLITKSPQRLILNASVKGQCARHKFYGTEEVEDFLAVLDARHAAAYRAVLREAWDASSPGVSDEDWHGLYEGLMVQRARVPAKTENMDESFKKLVLHVFREFLNASRERGKRDRAIAAIDDGKVKLKVPELATRWFALRLALDCVTGISDLQPRLLRNRTDYPFIFGDSPCVFYNRYFYDHEGFGALGFLTPGLMVLMPLDCDTMVFLHDPDTYELTDEIIDVRERSDISQLNALQIYAARNGVYFSDCRDLEYVSDLVAAHRVSCNESHGQLRIHPVGTLLVNGKPNDREIMQTFESQLPIRLDLSFLTTKQAPADDGPHRCRSPEISEMLMGKEAGVAGGVSAKSLLKTMLGDVAEDFLGEDDEGRSPP